MAAETETSVRVGRRYTLRGSVTSDGLGIVLGTAWRGPGRQEEDKEGRGGEIKGNQSTQVYKLSENEQTIVLLTDGDHRSWRGSAFDLGGSVGAVRRRLELAGGLCQGRVAVGLIARDLVMMAVEEERSGRL